MAGTLPAPPPFQPDPLAQAGLLGAHTMLARRASRPEFEPLGPSAGPCRFRSEQFGFSAYLPQGWTRQDGDALLVQPYGLVCFTDVEVITPGGSHARIGASREPVPTARDALDTFARMYLRSTGGRIFSTARRNEGVPSMDLTIALPCGDLLLCRLVVDGVRVIAVETLHATDSDADDDIMSAVHRAFDVIPEYEMSNLGFTSGTYRIR